MHYLHSLQPQLSALLENIKAASRLTINFLYQHFDKDTAMEIWNGDFETNAF